MHKKIMDVEVHIPANLLRPFIKAYIIIETQSELINKSLPETSLIMAFRFKGQINCLAGETKNSLPPFVVTGLRKSLREFHFAENTGNILVIFKEARVASFLKAPLYELFEASVSLDNFIIHQNLSIIEEQLAEAKNNAQRIALIERFLLSALYDHKPDKLVLTALQKIHLAKGVIKIRDLADILYISQDAFEKRFRRVVGTSPKQFSSIIRMTSIINDGLQRRTLNEIGLDAGYFDQSHFNKDFKLFTGQTPGDFFKSPASLQINDFLQ